jgi:hypothetical protein
MTHALHGQFRPGAARTPIAAASLDGNPARGILLGVAISVAGFWAPLALLIAQDR